MLAVLLRSCVILSITVLVACTPSPPVVIGPTTDDAKYESAPTPSSQSGRRSAVRSFEQPIPPKMPLGTGAVPVSSSPVRGSIVTGLKSNF